MASGASHPKADFEAVLSSLRRESPARRVRGNPFATAPFLAEGAPACGFAGAAETAFEDFAPQAARPQPLPSDATDVIASELALGGITNPGDLRRLRRRFLWANHPDRRLDLPRDLANRRVAIANMLIDRALAKF